MRVVVLGGGGLGMVLAGFLARAGAEVTLLVRPARLADYPDHAVRVTGRTEFTAPVRIAADSAALGACDYLIVCVKARDTEAALRPLAGLSVETVLSVQNGVAKDEALARVFGRARVLGATSAVGGERQRPGVSKYTLAGATLLGELDGGPSPRAERLAAMLGAGGLTAACVPDIGRRTWYKLAGFLRTAPVSALTRLDIATLTRDAALRRLCAGIALEAAHVAAAEGQPLWSLPPAYTDFGGGSGPTRAAPDAPWTEAELRDGLIAMGETLREAGVVLYPSLAQDIIAGRPTELEATAGDALARAARHGLATPLLATVTHLLRGVERGARARRGAETAPAAVLH